MVDETALELKNEIGEAFVPPAAPAIPEVTPVPAGPPAQPGPRPVAAVAHPEAPVAPRETAAVRQQAGAARPSVDAAAIGSSLAGGLTDAQLEQIQRSAAAEHDTEAAPPAIAAEQPDSTPKGDLPPRSGPSVALQIASAEPTVAVASIDRRVHHAGDLPRPIVCLVDSVADYLKAGVLASVFQDFPSLPRIVAVHTGVASDLGIDDLESLQLPLPAMGIHLGVSAGAFAAETSKIISAFDALATELEPCAVLRAGSGRRCALRASASETNAALIEKIADVLYTDSTESFYALYREGIRLDRVHSVGNLSREMLDLAMTTLDAAPRAVRQPSGPDATLTPGQYGLITVDTRTGFARRRDLSRAVELISELSEDLPMAWLLSPQSLHQIETSIHAELLKASRVVLKENTHVRQAFSLVRGAKCLVANDDGPWLEEARSLGITALVLTSDATLEPCDSAWESDPVGGAQDSVRARFARLLARAPAVVQPPEYWDAGTATRMAGQLINWFAKSAAQDSRRTNSAPVPVEP
jgi:UDP-N-acetylglucosamine 2-epimerase